jgi:hypothetical protein
LALAPELQLGMTVGMKVFSTKYVLPGFAVCQNFRNSNKVAYAALCIYGPTADNNTWGGIFLGGNFGEVIPTNVLSPVIASNGNTSASRSFSLESKSSVFAMDSVKFKEMSTQSTDWDDSVHDPKKELRGSKGYKTYRNIEKVLRVRR